MKSCLFSKGEVKIMHLYPTENDNTLTPYTLETQKDKNFFFLKLNKGIC